MLLYKNTIYIFTISRTDILRMKHIFDKAVQKIKTYISYSITVFRKSCRLRDMWKNIVERGRPQMTTWHMCIACQIPRVTNKLSVCVILTVFPLHQWLQERGSILRYIYIQWRTEGGFGVFKPPPTPKFRSFDKAEPNSQFCEKYIRNNLRRIRLSLIF